MTYPVRYTFRSAPAATSAPAVTRGDILALQSAMIDANGGADGLESCPLTHHHAPHVYGREMLIPAGTTIVGKIHRHAHLNVIVSGRAWVATEFGRREVRAGDIFVSEPGAKRAVHAIEDTRWLTIHPDLDDTRDLAALERYVIAPDYPALDAEKQERLQ